jgi:hypothetical protein
METMPKGGRRGLVIKPTIINVLTEIGARKHESSTACYRRKTFQNRNSLVDIKNITVGIKKKFNRLGEKQSSVISQNA